MNNLFAAVARFVGVSPPPPAKVVGNVFVTLYTENIRFANSQDYAQKPVFWSMTFWYE